MKENKTTIYYLSYYLSTSYTEIEVVRETKNFLVLRSGRKLKKDNNLVAKDLSELKNKMIAHHERVVEKNRIALLKSESKLAMVKLMEFTKDDRLFY